MAAPANQASLLIVGVAVWVYLKNRRRQPKEDPPSATPFENNDPLTKLGDDPDLFVGGAPDGMRLLTGVDRSAYDWEHEQLHGLRERQLAAVPLYDPFAVNFRTTAVLPNPMLELTP